MSPDLFQSFYDTVASKYGVKIKYKDESLLMKFISWILFFNKSFMIDYVSAVGSSVYFPSRKWIKSSSSTKLLAHELVHIVDRKKLPILFEVIYLFPQVLSVFSLLAILAITSKVWLMCLLFFLFLTPLPAYGRVYFEARAYAMNMHFTNIISGGTYSPLFDLDRYVDQFVGPGYFHMCWSKEHARKMLWNNYLELPNIDLLFMEIEDWYLKVQQEEKDNELKLQKEKPWL